MTFQRVAPPLVLLLLNCNSLIGQTLTQPQLWRAHVIYQSYVQGDYVTPLVLGAMAREISRNPNGNYDALINSAAEAQKAFKASKQYAETGHFSDPFEKEQAVAAWAKDAAKFSKNPIITGLADGISLTFRLGSGVTDMVTALDDKQSMLLRDSLRSAAYKRFDATLTTIQAAKSSGARAAFDTVLRSSLNVSTSDSPQQIAMKSPALVSAVNSQKILDKQLTKEDVNSIIASNLAQLSSENQAAYNDIKDIRARVASIADYQQRELQLQKEIADKKDRAELHAAKIEAAHASIYLVSALISDPATAQRVQTVGEGFVRAYEGIEHYSETITKFGSNASGFAELALLGTDVNVFLSISSAFLPQDSASTTILHELGVIQAMISDLNTLVNARFDQLLAVVDGYGRATIEGLNKVLTQQAITLDSINQIREVMAQQQIRMDHYWTEYELITRDEHAKSFTALQRVCYLNKNEGIDTAPISKATFNDCIEKFFGIAVDSAHLHPFSDSPPIALNLSEMGQRLREPYDALNLLGQRSIAYGSSFRPATVMANPVIWRNASLALLATLEAWPNYRQQVSLRRLEVLLKNGNDIRSGIESMIIAKAPCPKDNSDCSPYFGVYKELLDQHQKKLNEIAKLMNNLATTYAQANLHGFNPFRYDRIRRNVRDAAGTGKAIPSEPMPMCPGFVQPALVFGDQKNVPGPPISIPSSVWAKIDTDLQIALLIGSPDHPVSFCYQMRNEDQRYYVFRWNDHNTRYANIEYLSNPIADIVISTPEGVRQRISVKLPAMMWGRVPMQTPPSDWRFVREYDITNVPAEIQSFRNTFKEHYYPGAFHDWWATNSVSAFQNSAEANFLLEEGKTYTQTNQDTAAFGDWVFNRIIEQKWVIARDIIAPEFARAGDLSTALDELDGLKRLIQLYVFLGLPESIETDVGLQRAIFDDEQLLGRDQIQNSLAADLARKKAARSPAKGSFEEPTGVLSQLIDVNSRRGGWIDLSVYAYLEQVSKKRNSFQTNALIDDTLVVLESQLRSLKEASPAGLPKGRAIQ